MRNRDVLRVWGGLSKITDKKNTKFSFVVLRNKKLLKDVVESLKTIQVQKVDGYDDFNEDRLKLCEKYAEKDEHGQPIQVKQGGEFVFKISNQKEFGDGILKLFDLHENYKENLKQKQKAFDKLQDEDVDINLIKIDINELPSDLTESEISLIEEIIYEK